MTIAEARIFYNEDKKNYEIENNKDFLSWWKSTVNNGYHSFIGLNELQELVDFIVNWYEIKYPEKELESNEGITYIDFEDIKKISDVMDIKQLMYRLSHNKLCLMECGYRASGWSQQYKDGEFKLEIFMSINKKGEEKSFPYMILNADYMTGEVLGYYGLKKYIDSDDSICLDELLEVFDKKYADELDYTELKESVYDHNCDMELRHRILQLVALKLLYSKNTIPERGYERAKRFISEFNKELDLTLSTEEIDEIMKKDYAKDEKNTSKTYSKRFSHLKLK